MTTYSLESNLHSNERGLHTVLNLEIITSDLTFFEKLNDMMPTIINIIEGRETEWEKIKVK